MALLGKKKVEVTIANFCRNFYETSVFDVVIGDVDVGRTFYQTAYDTLVKADSSAAAIPFETFWYWMLVARLELFGLAFAHMTKDTYWLEELQATKGWLKETGRQDTWSDMLDFNRAVAESAGGVQGGERAARARTVFINEFRMKVYDKWVAAGIDEEIAARAANRLDSEGAWRKGLTTVFLLRVLEVRLHHEFNDEAQFQLGATLFGNYQGARETVQEVKLLSARG